MQLFWAVDGAVQRLGTAYDTASRPFQFTSYDTPEVSPSSVVMNRVQRTFNGFSQLVSEAQTVTLGSPRVVQYGYSETPLNAGNTGVRNHSRPTALVYPNARLLAYRYGSGLNDTISRLADLAEGGQAREAFTYLGLGTVVERAHPQPGVHLTYVQQPGDPAPLAGEVSEPGDPYRGLDRFGRVRDQRWRRTADGLPSDRFGYGYDRNSNRLYRENRFSSQMGHLSQTYSELYHAGSGYDPFDQLTAFTRGQLNPGRNGIEGTPQRSQTWALDGLGNWSTVTTNGVAQARTHNRQNQIETLGSAQLDYDHSGNTVGGEAGKEYGYDAWNRLVRVTAGGLTVNYTFDALGRRVQQTKTGGADAGTREFSYSDGWQILEERDGLGVVVAQNVWSPVYVDALVLRDQGGQRLYVQQDANANVTAITDAAGSVLERYAYDPYGAVTVLTAAWQVSPSLSTWVYLHQGGRYDSDTGLYDFRNRYYEPKLGRWLNLDPIGYSAGDSVLYGYLGNGPINGTDPSGLQGPGDVEFLGGVLSGRYSGTSSLPFDPWRLQPNWKDGTGSLVNIDQEMIICFGKGISDADLGKYEDYVWEGMKTFKMFNKSATGAGNLANVRTITPDEETLKKPELKGAVLAAFKTVANPEAIAQQMVAGDGPNREVFVRVFIDEQSRVISAVTLGNHMIVGIRQWQVRSFKAEENSPGAYSKGDRVIRVATWTWERRNGLATNAGFWTAGKKRLIRLKHALFRGCRES